MQHCKHEAYCQHKEWTANDDLTRTTRNWVMGFASRLKPRRFEQSTYAPPVVNVQQPPAQVGALNPGETAYRVLSGQADIKPQLGMGLVCGGFVAVLGGCVYVVIAIPNAWPLAVIGGITDLVAGAVFVRLNWDVLVQGKDTRLVARERMPETQPATDPPKWAVEGKLQVGEHKTIYSRFDLTDPQAWHKFCRAVHFDGKNFSGTEAIDRQGVPPSDWDTAWGYFKEHGWASLKKRRSTPDLSPVGKAMVRQYATQAPEER